MVSRRDLRKIGKTIFKGASPGSFWEQTDARARGSFQGRNAGARWTVADITRHITGPSNPSVFCSFTTSYAVAHKYASGPPKTRGLIYVLDPAKCANAVPWVNPVEEVAAANRHLHEGDWQLLQELVAQPLGPPLSLVPHYGGASRVPAFSGDLRALLSMSSR